MSTDTVTPSLARGIQPVVRTPDFMFNDDLAEDWFSGDAGLTSFWNAFGVIAGVAEAQFIDTGRWLLAQMDDPAVIEETTRFIQQEAQHAAVHARMNRVLAARGYPVEATRGYVSGLVDELRRRFGDGAMTAMALACEQAIGELGHAVMANPEVLDSAAETPRNLLLWHFYEEVEHQAALHDGFEHVCNDDKVSRAYRRLGAVLMLVVLGAVIPAVSWAFCRHGFSGQQRRRSTWRPLFRQLFGSEGLLRHAGTNIRAFMGERFHPFDLHDPVPTLQARRGYVKPEWEKPPRKLTPTNVSRESMHLSRVQTGLRVAGFAGSTLSATWRYLRDTRPG